jgi:hypothetical protein
MGNRLWHLLGCHSFFAPESVGENCPGLRRGIAVLFGYFDLTEDKSMKNKTWIWITAAVLALALLVTGMVMLYLKFRPQAVSGQKHITVTVVHKDGTQKEFTYDTDEEYLGTVLQQAGLIQGEVGPYGMMISTVDGELADWNVDQGYWALYVGQEYATTGIDTTPIRNGDSFRLEYTIG